MAVITYTGNECRSEPLPVCHICGSVTIDNHFHIIAGKVVNPIPVKATA